ncbi:SH3 domain-containing protein [Microbacterium sp. BG28]|uniref:SH3 domain-containing protein n=1 Tax=Microbacterium sp. BG28 TaxID=3097356 RepID=UPI002A5A5B62|nr:SH3 domain-containing protein [Microbacterium sp. BG28]MDY0829821.1 SH3 domain-containing protein [Microbacterium sp. BG28]
MRAQLTADHEIPDRAPLIVHPGDRVAVGQRDTEWPAFVFVTAATGCGWVPARHIDIDGAAGIVRTGYDTTELAARTGDVVEILTEDTESGWSWCRDTAGREGWVPDRVLARG